MHLNYIVIMLFDALLIYDFMSVSCSLKCAFIYMQLNRLVCTYLSLVNI